MKNKEKIIQQKKTKRSTKKANPMQSTGQAFVQKIIFVTGGVVSSIGKGLAAASIGTLLESRGLKVTIMKCDPYLNVDPGTMSPLQHGEVYVTDDGAETDLDLGHYERFTSGPTSRSNSITSGKIYEQVIMQERRGDYLGGTVQVIPHVTNEIKSCIHEAAQGAEVLIVEIGGTVGDIEGLPFLEAIRQMRSELGYQNTALVHVTYVPYIKAAGELKTKPTQHSVKDLREIGLQPDFLICRTEQDLGYDLKAKIGLFCNVKPEDVITARDASSIYEVPLMFHEEGLDESLIERLNLENSTPDLKNWEQMVRILNKPVHSVVIGIVGKYVELKESYKSLHEALIHGGIANNSKVDIVYVDSDKLTETNVVNALSCIDAVLVPGGFGERGVDGKMLAIKHAREKQIPFFGICYGMQLAAIEFARNVCGIRDATSREILEKKKKSRNFIVDYMVEQKNIKDMGGTMRLGAYPCELSPNSHVKKIYGVDTISERHRHRYEFNNKFKGLFKKHGMNAVGICKERNLVEIVEISDHPWFVGVQFHPEFKSKPTSPHPLFSSFIKAALSFKDSIKGKKKKSRKKTVDSESQKKLQEFSEGVQL